MIWRLDPPIQREVKITEYFTKQPLVLKHLTTRMIFLYCFFLLNIASLTSGKAMVSLKLIRYENPSHREITGRHCKWFDENYKPPGVCNNRFSLCIDEIGRSDIMDYCAFVKMDYFYSANKDKFFFPSAFGIYGENPIVFEVPNYTGGFQVKLDIWNKEIFHVNEEGHIDFCKEDIYVKPSFTNPYYRTLFGRGHSKTKIAVKVSCASDFYDDKCSTYCNTNGSNLEGSYQCDPLTGARVFRPEFEGPLLDTSWTRALLLWRLIVLSTGFVFGIFLTLCLCKAHITTHSEDIKALESNTKYEKLSNIETIV